MKGSNLTPDERAQVAADLEAAAQREWQWALCNPRPGMRMNHARYAQKLAGQAREYRETAE